MKSHIYTGYIILAFGICTICFPTVFEVCYKLGLSDVTAQSLIQSLIGGTEIALGIALIWADRLGFHIQTLLMLCTLILLNIAILRIITMLSHMVFSRVGLLELGAEVFGAIWLRHKAQNYPKVVKS